MEVAAFSGQGIPSGQMAELRRVARVPVVSTFLRCLSDRLTEALATLPPATLLEHFEHGLDVAAWASCDASSGPPALYFNSASVTLVLTLVVQLACFRYAWVRSGAYPAQASVGHSQGLAAALVVALSSCERSFEQHATELAATLLWFGLAVAEAIPRADSYALAVLKLDVAEVAALAADEPAVHLAVVNGARACTLAGAPADLLAFQRRLPAAASSRLLPVCAPFHCASLLGAARDAALARIEKTAATTADADGPAPLPLPASALLRPCWSCVDGSDLHHTDEPSLRHYLVRALSEWRVDWPCAVASVAAFAKAERARAGARAVATATTAAVGGDAPACRLVDYGPGGGSGVARMSAVVAKELGLASEAEAGAAPLLVCEYFTQRHCVAGPLPQSWLAWVRSAEDDASLSEEEETGDGARRLASPPAVAAPAAAAAATTAAATAAAATPAKEGRGKGSKGDDFVWFSDRLKAASGGGETIDFTDAAVRAAIAPEVGKMRTARAEAMQRQRRATSAALRPALDSAAFDGLRRDATTLRYDAARHNLAHEMAALLGLPAELPLHRLHERFHSDSGARRARHEKAALLAPLTDAAARAPLVAAYERLVVEVLAPRVAAAMGGGCVRVVFQAFPCVRVHRPGEFSIGPHCDAQYQAPEGNLNFYVPLSRAIWGTNSLFVESAPGREDWRPLMLRHGEIATFDGLRCAHFTAENTTAHTRVSLDFRLVPGGCYEEDVAMQPRDFLVGAYYSECRRSAGDGDGDAVGGFEVTRRGEPYWRHGFPFTNR